MNILTDCSTSLKRAGQNRANYEAKLSPYFKADGTVTAGNASGIVDGAAALVLTSAGKARALNLQPLGRLVAWGNVGVEPSIMGIGPVTAVRTALEKAGLTLEDMDLVEINEAFSTQYLAVEKELGLDRLKTKGADLVLRLNCLK